VSAVACIIIAHAKRLHVLDTEVVPSALAVGFAEVVVVGDYHSFSGGRFLRVPALTATTTDALIKRDVGTLATKAPWLFYLADDHAVRAVGECPRHFLDIGVPTRFCKLNGERLLLNMGLDTSDPNAPYCGGHAGLFHRELIQRFPWSAQPHDRLWDLLSSRSLAAAGARLGHQLGWEVEDVSGERPWL
jgi:hypothetical protein